LITPAQVKGHPNSHVIRRYLGGANAPEVDLRMFLYGYESDEQAERNQGVRLQKRDIIMLCSDGLTDLVQDDEILEIIRTNGNKLNQTIEELIDLANIRGGHDNTTIILFSIPDDIGIEAKDQDAPPKLIVEPEATSQKKGGCLPILLLPIIGLSTILVLGSSIL